MNMKELGRRVLMLPPSLQVLALDHLEHLRSEVDGEAPVRFKRLPLYPKQEAIVADPARFTITEATTKAGKTFSHLEWLLDEATRTNEGHWWWIATVKEVADIAFRRACDRMAGYIDSSGERQKVSDPIPHTKNLTRKIITVGGATLWFKSADEPDSLFGEDVRAAVGDEVTRWKETAWHALYTTLTATKGRVKLIGNVKGRRNFAYRLARRAEAGESGWGYHKLTAYDAIDGGVVSQDIVEQAERDLPPHVFRELYLAEAAADEGNPFGLSAIRAARQDELSTKDPVVWGWDIARAVDWTVGIALDEDGRQCRPIERWQQPWPETIEAITQLSAGLPTLIDATGVGDGIYGVIEREHPNVEAFKFSSPSKQHLMESLALALQAGEVGWYDEVIGNELEEFEYQYYGQGRVRYSAPSGMHDDCVCALALAVQHRSAARTSKAMEAWLEP